jgi:TfoX/Sxy family transcriptional regulator of competence genes
MENAAIIASCSHVHVGTLGRVAYDEELADRIRELVARERGISERRMFGGLAFLVDGHMAVSASGQGGLLVRVDPDETERLVGRDHVRRFEMRGRSMDGWLRVDDAGLRAKRQLAGWVTRSVKYARSLPPKR